MYRRSDRGSAFALFMDDIRMEVDGKNTFVGVYGDTVLLPSIPCTVARIGTACYFVTSSERPIEKLAIKIVQADGSFVEHPVPLDAQPSTEEQDHEMIKYQLLGVVSPFVVKKEGQLTAFIIVDDEEIEAGHVNVRADSSIRELNPLA